MADLGPVVAFLDKYGLANTSGERHKKRQIALAAARAALPSPAPASQPEWDPDDDGDHSAFTHRDDDEPPPYVHARPSAPASEPDHRSNGAHWPECVSCGQDWPCPSAPASGEALDRRWHGDPIREALVEFVDEAAGEMLVRMEHGARKFAGTSWRTGDYSDEDNLERIRRAVDHLEAARRNVDDPAEWRKRAADVANQAFMFADPLRARSADEHRESLERASQPAPADPEATQ